MLNEISVERPLHEVLGIAPIQYASEELAPPVDHHRLTAFVRRQLPGVWHDETCRLVSTFRSWHEALGEALRREVRNDPDRGDLGA